MIKVRAGQVWGNEHFKFEIKAVHLPAILFTDNERTTVANLYERYKFIPQNDLEWLAVNEPVWKTHAQTNNSDFFKVIRKDEDWGVMYHEVSNDAFYWWSRKEWQSMRYHLGLDKKPHYRQVKGEWVKQ